MPSKNLSRPPLLTTAVLFVTVVAVSLSLLSHGAAVGVRCGQIDVKLAPCMPYLEKGGDPSFYCCLGVSTLADETYTTSDRQAICRCLERLDKAIPKINGENFEELPEHCHIKVPFPISFKTDCNKIK